MWPDPQFSADLVTFTEKIFNEKLHFLCSVEKIQWLVKWFLYECRPGFSIQSCYEASIDK